MKIKTWLNYRRYNHNLEASLSNALSFYQTRYGYLPPCIRVHPTWAQAAREAVPVGIKVETNGGTLVGEVWLPQPEDLPQQRMEETA